jgi:hypothetical protein
MKKAFGAMIFALIPAALSAQPIAVHVTARVTTVDDVSSVLKGHLRTGDVLDAVYVYDRAAAPFLGADEAGYWFVRPPYGLTVTGSGLTFASDPHRVLMELRVVDRPELFFGDVYNVWSLSNQTLADGTLVDHIGVNFNGPFGDPILGLAPPTAPPNPADWESARIVISGHRPNGVVKLDDMFTVYSDVISAELVPAPSAPPLLDADLDSVPDELDFCADTRIPEGITEWAMEHLVLFDRDPLFDDRNGGNGSGNWRTWPRYAVADTHGCSCEQILQLRPDQGTVGQGCSLGTIKDFIDNPPPR